MSNPDIERAAAHMRAKWDEYETNETPENLANFEAARASLLEVKNDQLKAENKELIEERDKLRATLVQKDTVKSDMGSLGYNETPSPEKRFRAYSLSPIERAEALFSKGAGE